MININNFKQFVDTVSNKNGKGTIPPVRFNSIVRQALWEWTSKQYGNEEEYQPGRPVPRYAYEMTTKIIDNLRHLKVTAPLSPNSEGKITVPDGTTKDKTGTKLGKYLHFSSLRVVYKVYSGDKDSNICGYSPNNTETRPVITYEKNVNLVRDDEVATYLDSSIRMPTVEFPICTLFGEYIQIYPKKGIQDVFLTYLREPQTPVWGYIISNERPVYDSSSSIDIDAPEESFNKIAMGVLALLGISIREEQLIQYAEMNKIKGI
jgi:hypothetical protein